MNGLDHIKRCVEEILSELFPEEFSKLEENDRIDQQLTSMQLALLIASINNRFLVTFGTSLSDISALRSIHDLATWIKENRDDTR